jgi:hypothetical protein
MYVKLRTIMAGPDCSGQPGQVVLVDDKRGELLVKGGFAEPAAAPRPAVAPLTDEEIEAFRSLNAPPTKKSAKEDQAAAPEGKVEEATEPLAEETAEAPEGRGRRRDARAG